MSLLPPLKVEKLQKTLHAKAKGSPNHRGWTNWRNACHRLRQWLRQKHKMQGQRTSRYSDEHLHDELGLVRFLLRKRNVPWANA